MIKKRIENNIYNLIEIKIDSNITIDDIFTDEDVKDYVSGRFSVDELFSKEDLEDWALKNGFIKE